MLLECECENEDMPPIPDNKKCDICQLKFYIKKVTCPTCLTALPKQEPKSNWSGYVEQPDLSKPPNQQVDDKHEWRCASQKYGSEPTKECDCKQEEV